MISARDGYDALINKIDSIYNHNLASIVALKCNKNVSYWAVVAMGVYEGIKMYNV